MDRISPTQFRRSPSGHALSVSLTRVMQRTSILFAIHPSIRPFCWRTAGLWCRPLMMPASIGVATLARRDCLAFCVWAKAGLQQTAQLALMRATGLKAVLKKPVRSAANSCIVCRLLITHFNRNFNSIWVLSTIIYNFSRSIRHACSLAQCAGQDEDSTALVSSAVQCLRQVGLRTSVEQSRQFAASCASG